jgi:hypothetical protein
MCLHLNLSVRMSELSCYEAGILMQWILGDRYATCQPKSHAFDIREKAPEDFCREPDKTLTGRPMVTFGGDALGISSHK